MHCLSCGRQSYGSGVCPVCGGPVVDFDFLSREVEKLQRPLGLAYEEMVGQIADIARQAQDLEAALARSLRPTWTLPLEDPSFSEIARTVDASFLALSKQTEAALEPLSRLPDLASTFALDLDRATDQAAGLIQRIHRDWETKWATGIEDFLREATLVLRASEISLRGEALAVDGVAIDPEEIERFLAGAEDLDLQALPRLIEEPARAKDRARYVVVLAWFLQNVILPLLISLSAAQIHDAWRDRPAERKATIRLVKEETERRAAQALEAGIPRQALKGFRVVTANTLNVRARPARKSSPIGVLHVGHVVHVVRSSKRSWTLVEWTPPDGEARIRGWVFSRYLKKLRLPRTPGAIGTEQSGQPGFLASH